MESVIKKIFSGVNDSFVHEEFIKYSRGAYPGKYTIKVKKQKEVYIIKTTSEFVNFVVRKVLEGAKGEVDVKGLIIATFKVNEGATIPISKIKQFMGIKQAVIDGKVNPQDVIVMMDKYPRAFFPLSFSTGSEIVKTKPKMAKSPKPPTGGKDKEIKVDFCTLTTTNKEIVQDLLFGCENLEKEAMIKNTLVIEEVEIPQGVNDPVLMREQSKRKGKITREIIVDGKSTTSEAKFFA